MAQFALSDFVLIPLTPIHIGGGEEAKLGPENYRIRDNRLERVNLRRLLLRGNKAGLQLQGGFQDQIFERLRDEAGPDDIEDSIALAPESAREIGKSGALRQGKVDGFQRSGGAPVLPGSSLKGALRTAWLAHCAKGVRLPRDANDLTVQAFALNPQHKTDTDPFRDLLVEDAVIAAGDTMIDRIFSWKKGEGGQYTFKDTGQMHWEMLRAVADGGEPPVIRLRLGLRDNVVRAQRGQTGRVEQPKRAPSDIAALLRAATAQHGPVWKADLDRFFAGRDDRLKQTLQLFRHLKRDDPDPDAALIRLGRGGHAESKSVAQFRQVEIRNPKTNEKRKADYGTTRHVVKVGDMPVSLGWALLVRADRWQAPERWLAPPAAAPRAAGSPTATTAPSPRAASALGQQLRYAKGQRVLVNGDEGALLDDVTEAARPDDEVRVNFGGDIDKVKIKYIEGLA